MVQGQRIYLDALREADALVSAQWMSNLDITSTLWNAPLRPSDVEIEREFQRQADKSSIAFAVRLLHDKTVVGFTRFKTINHRNGVAEISIVIGDPGKGFGREALTLLIEYGFRELNLNRIELTVLSFNAAAIHLYQKLGFQQEGVLRQHLFRDGTYHDTWVMALLRDEWTNLPR
ncbi:MAG: GNAT family N-acetyltransferase [Chloroflexi bacterium]|nr:GNAT family N-acetyltransferase [Chloroflexota bacterium]